MTYPPETPSTYPPEEQSGYAEDNEMSAYPSSVVETPPGFGSDQNDQSSTAGAAKEQAAAVTGTAAQAGQQVADVVKSEAGNVAQQANHEARNLLGQTREELSSQAGSQQQRAAGGLRSLHSELQDMASKSETDGPAAQLVRQVADRAGSAASWLENRDPGQIVTEVQRFARQRPGAFLAVAAVAGLLAGRLTRGLTADSSSGGSSDGARSDLSTSPTNPALLPPPDSGWQTGGTASYGADLDPAQAYDAPQPQPPTWSQDPSSPIGDGGYAPGTGGVDR